MAKGTAVCICGNGAYFAVGAIIPRGLPPLGNGAYVAVSNIAVFTSKQSHRYPSSAGYLDEFLE